MPDYELLYAVLFESVTEAIEQLEAQNYGRAKEILRRIRESGRQSCFPPSERGEIYEQFRTPAVLYANRRAASDAPGATAAPAETLPKE